MSARPRRSLLIAAALALILAGSARASGPPRAVQPPPVAMPISVPIPLAGEPIPGNMAYFGGRVLLTPHVYLTFWGWHGRDDDGVARQLTHFYAGIGGSSWEQVTTQYYEQSGNHLKYVANPRHQLSGLWYDEHDPIHDNLADTDIALEAQRAVTHFSHGHPDPQASYVIATPSFANSTDFNQHSYCAWHDSTADGRYPGVQGGIAFTDLPYILNAGSLCGQGNVNHGQGRLDGVTEAAGHEYLETITDPTPQSPAWMDANRDENADKCNYVQYGPGAVTNIRLNTGTFAVQGSWSNQGLDGIGACATS